MIRSLALALAILAPLPAAADEFTDTLDSARKAYDEGDVDGARQDLDYAGKLLGELKSESLGKFLPAALPGWTREATEPGEAAGMMGMLGGGNSAAAKYTKDGTELTITLIANAPMVSGIASMLSGLASRATGGKPVRIQRTEFTMNDQDLQGVVDGKVLVSVSGDASLADKTAYLEAMDFKALAGF